VEKKWWLSKTLWLNALILLLAVLEPVRAFVVEMGWDGAPIVASIAILNKLVRIFGTESKIERKLL
jgi:hypothetical protein